ncbi:FG-GAP repeat domain-containing protein [Pseudooceanicola sp. MF1-13]|uniref:FG-GAP repeat domain-containing protein n=1 Tax=Pseudooceanicola sp. MF1-13 TaxID=3379095 RepID=UPI0038925FCF
MPRSRQPEARRNLRRMWQRLARRAGLTLCLWFGALAGAANAQDDTPLITGASYDGPTDRYAHGVLGDAIEHTTLVLSLDGGIERRFTLPEDMVFEDTAPRLADVTGDGRAEVIVVETSLTQGARLTVYTAEGRLASTPYIGQPNRWLAPLGAADIDGDGAVEIAYVDRPHLIKTLRLVRLDGRDLIETASLKGVTNHRIGWDYIVGGIRTCTGRPEIILSTGDFLVNLSVFWAADDRLDTRAEGRFTGRESVERLLACE